MRSLGGIDLKGFERLRESLHNVSKERLDEHAKRIAADLAGMLLTKITRRTPVGVYDNGRVGGNLRKNWHIDEAVKEVDGGYEITIYNNTEYASYVEFGHRQEIGKFVPALGKRLVKGWVEGRFMVTRSEMEFRNQAQRILTRRIEAIITRALNGQ